MATILRAGLSFADHPLLDGLDAAALRTVESASRLERLPAGTLLGVEPQRDRGLRLLLAGRARLHRVGSDGRQLTLALLGEGDAFGAVSPRLEASGERVEVLDDALVSLIRADLYERVLLAVPAFSANLLAYAAERLCESEAQLERLAFRSVGERLAATLAGLMERYGKVTPSGIRIEGRFTHAQLADMIGTSRETLTKALGELREAGVVDVRERLLWVIDPTGLEAARGGA